MNKAKFAAFLAVILLGVLVILAFAKNVSSVGFNSGDRIIAELPPNSFKVNQLSPVGIPSGKPQSGSFTGPTAAPAPTGQEPYSGQEP